MSENPAIPNGEPTTTTTTPNQDGDNALSLSTSLTHQCRLLLAELDIFQTALASRFRKHQQQQHIVEMRQLRSNVSSELKTLERLAADTRKLVERQQQQQQQQQQQAHKEGEQEGEKDLEMEERRLVHTLRSSNLPFYMTVWTIAKVQCKGVVAFSKRFYRETKPVVDDGTTQQPDGKQTKGSKMLNQDKKNSTFVDIVHDDGAQWLKISTISENRLLFEMAEKGWGIDEDEDDPEELQNRTVLRNNDSDSDEDDENDQLELIKMATDMIKTARSIRVRYKNPLACLMVPKLVEGRIPEIDRVLNTIRSLGVAVECGPKILPDFMNDKAFCNRDPDSLSANDLPLSTLLPNPFERFTNTVNVDCTILLAIVSDLSHKHRIAPSAHHHRAIVRQIEVEEEIPLLSAELWPAMGSRQLVCTEEAVRRMKEIVDTIGTETEKKRTAIFFGEGDMQGLDREELLQQFQQVSDHRIPKQWQLPIKTVDATADINDAWQHNRLPPVARKVSELLTDINCSVFLYGWVKDIVTITSNKTVVKQIESEIEANRGDDNELKGPMVWVCDTARSLIGKDKNRKP
ncbi:uncharacterized protein TRUGW13939_06371 [Talaromyces rugulosus]|uniref:DUF1308 domain-containing protein n=1 Tax=Talaromyces rugulosus TaxID=121627 RepID=A0A7H8QYR2_TALRU|nr:uncharacterized protein TRUGW13939_06371 [Talaromyces rugulosus]QKX59239.1 hypothetical protein TRUGW13939_06371 [Talaromyces rugulosus]